MPPLVIDLMQGWRADLLRGDEAMQQEMARRWLGVEQALQAQVDALALELEGSGRTTLGQLQRSRRYQQLMHQVDDELARYARFTGERIAARQRALLTAAISHSQAAINAVGADGELLLQFNRLPVAAVENMVGLTGAGTPVGEILADASRVGPDALRQSLIDGIALGRNPLETARRALRQGLAQSFTRMATIARTETLRVYRETTLESYRQSNVVAGYRRLCAKDERTCLGCLMADGRQYSLDQPFDEHPNGRCALVPVLRSTPPVQFETGPEWFERQPESVQRSMLGPSRFDLWQRGEIGLGDLVTRRWDDTWGGALAAAPVRSLPGGARALQRLASQRVTPAATPTPVVQRSSPVSNVLQLNDTTSTTGRAAADAMAAIDAVHDDGSLPGCVIDIGYEPPGSAYGWYLSADKKIFVNNASFADHPQMTTAHEIGHFIDDGYLNIALGFGNSAHVDAQSWLAWTDAIDKSNAVKVLQQIKLNNGAIPGTSLLVLPSHIDYLLSKPECWARSYAQFVARRSQNRDMIEQLERMQNDPIPVQWEDKDFEPIDQAIETILKGVGWMQ